MSHIAAVPHSAGHRYSWCPSCDELWVTVWMAAEGVRCCPVCDGRLLGYVGRSPYDMPCAHTDDPPGPATVLQTRDGRISALTSVGPTGRSAGGS
jgi:hypothetical protein